MRVGIQFPCRLPPERLVPFARDAESAGLDELWLVEDCFFAAGISSATAALGATTRIAVGLGILPSVARNAAFTAMELATVARLFPGRFLPGIGHGVAAWMRQIGAMPASQLAALEEVTVAVRRLLAGEEVTVHGGHVQLDAVRLAFPPDPVPPVVLGVRNERSLAVSGRVADGTILAEGSSAAYVAWARERIAAAGPHRLTVFSWWGRTHDELRPTVAGSLRKDRNDIRLEPAGLLEEVAAWRAAGAATAEVPDGWIDTLAVVGDLDAAIEQGQRLGPDAFVLSPVADDPFPLR